jgi:4-carboxymuconolactone decarboxylase
MNEDARRGRALRQELFGPASDDFMRKNAAAQLIPEFNRLTEEVLFGQVWTGPGLQTAERSLITIAALVATGKEAQLKAHIAGGLRVGLTQEKIAAAIVHLAFYVGWPAAVTALEIAREVFAAAKPAAP